MIGPFSLAGRLLDVTKTMLYLVDEPDMVRAKNPPPSPVKKLGKDGEVCLVPIGATQIRMTVLPWFE